MMGLQYENRRGRIDYLQEGKTKTGKPKYDMGQKITGTALDAARQGIRPEDVAIAVVVQLRLGR
jgi:hypothetical protein